jgi:hypothetical protein
VLSTPRVLALMERATVEALEGALDQGTTTVGARVELEHLLATPVGVPVQVSATLEVVDGRRLDFSAEPRQGRTFVPLRNIASNAFYLAIYRDKRDLRPGRPFAFGSLIC